MKTIEQYLDEAKKIFVTIDVDYWNPAVVSGRGHDMINALNFALVHMPRRKVTAITNHHHVLKHIYRTKFDLLINIDSHSDLCYQSFACSCGTWAEYVEGKKNKKFLWIHDLEREATGCCDGGSLFPRAESTVSDEEIGYNNIASSRFNCSRSKRLMEMIMARKSKICGLNLCRSPYYSKIQQNEFMDHMSSIPIRVAKGVLVENNKYLYRHYEIEDLKRDIVAGVAIESS